MHAFYLYPAYSTHPGLHRERNEDAWGYEYPVDAARLNTYGALFIVADGVGSRDAGDTASKHAVTQVLQSYYASLADTPAERLTEALLSANANIYAMPGDSATTLTAAVILNESLIIAHVGDSCAYWLDANGVRQLTQDHIAIPDPQQPKRTRLTRALGHKEHVKIDIDEYPVQQGGRLMLMTDGVTRYADDDALYVLGQKPTPQDTAHALVNRALSGGAHDNITLIVVEIGAPVVDEPALQQHIAGLSPAVEVTYTPDTPPAPPVATPAPTVSQPSPTAIAEAPAPARRAWLPWLIVLAVLLLGGGGALLVLAGQQDTESTAALPSATSSATPTLTETPNPPTATLTATPIPPNPPSATPTATPNPPSATPPPMTPTEAPLTENMRLVFDEAATTFERIADDVTAYALVPGTTYVIAQTHRSQTDGRIWYQLLDPESEQNGWIAEGDLPPYRTLP